MLNYFGEQYDGGARVLSSPEPLEPKEVTARQSLAPLEIGCNACDNCLSPRQTWDGTVAAQKFLSCVYRIREKSGFGVGVQHIVEVLCGAETEKIRKWDHHTLSTYNIGG